MEGGWASSLLPSCSSLYCAAAVSAGMAPLTICSLIANIRVHFLRHWTGTERWRPVLWAFSPSLCFSCSTSRPLCGVRTHRCAGTSPTAGCWDIWLLWAACVSGCPSDLEKTHVQRWSGRNQCPRHIWSHPPCDSTRPPWLHYSSMVHLCSLYISLNCFRQNGLMKSKWIASVHIEFITAPCVKRGPTNQAPYSLSS